MGGYYRDELIVQSAAVGSIVRSVSMTRSIRRTIKLQEGDPRRPAILQDDAWSTWLGEGDATPATAKAVLKTMEGVNWQAAPEPKEAETAQALMKCMKGVVSPSCRRRGNKRPLVTI